MSNRSLRRWQAIASLVMAIISLAMQIVDQISSLSKKRGALTLITLTTSGIPLAWDTKEAIRTSYRCLLTTNIQSRTGYIPLNI